MRKRTPAISRATAWKAPPSTRIVIGSTSTRGRVGGPGWRPTSYSTTDTGIPLRRARRGGRVLARVDDDVPEAVDARREPRRDDRRRVVLVNDRGPGQHVPR